MSDILHETWAYQEILKERELKASYQDVLNVIQARFPALLLHAKKQMEDSKDTELLSRTNVKLGMVQTSEEALEYLFTFAGETDTVHGVPTVGRG